MNSNNDRLPIVLFLIGAALVGAMLFKRHSQKQNRQAVPVTAATPEPIFPTPSPTPQAEPPSQPTAPPIPPSNLPPNAVITEPEKVKALMDKLAKSGAGNGMNIASFQAEALRKGQIMSQALTSESSAREALKELETCVTQPNPFASSGMKLPEGAAQQMAQAQASARANCVSTAKQIAEKFPALKNEAENKIIHPKK